MRLTQATGITLSALAVFCATYLTYRTYTTAQPQTECIKDLQTIDDILREYMQKDANTQTAQLAHQLMMYRNAYAQQHKQQINDYRLTVDTLRREYATLVPITVLSGIAGITLLCRQSRQK